MSIKYLGKIRAYICFLKPPHQTGHRVFPGTAFRRPSPSAYQQPLSLIHRLGPLTRSYVPARLCFSASSLSSCRRLFRFLGQFRSGAWAILHVHSTVPTPGRRAFMHPSPFAKRDRSTALRSGRLMLFRPSSLQGRSDFPYIRNALLTGITSLKARLPPLETEGTRGAQARSPVICPCMPLTLPRVPGWCKCPLLPNRQWPSP